MAKRAFDLLFASLGLIALLPLFALIALWIKADTAGPVFFRQERIGRHGQPFRIHKFRTMAAQPVEGAAQITVGRDPRITRAGAVLRRYKLDELAQLIDVLQGTMSLVGPRPEVPRYVALYPQALRDIVLSVRPGITDPASLRFHNEGELLSAAANPEREYIEVVMPRKLQLSVDYVRQASLAGDLRLILNTLSALRR